MNCNRKTALERSLGKLLGVGVKLVYSRETLPLILMQLQIKQKITYGRST